MIESDSDTPVAATGHKLEYATPHVVRLRRDGGFSLLVLAGLEVAAFAAVLLLRKRFVFPFDGDHLPLLYVPAMMFVASAVSLPIAVRRARRCGYSTMVPGLAISAHSLVLLIAILIIVTFALSG
jgi:hypothetical protein